MPVGLYSGAQTSIGNGVTTVFPYGWKILDQAHIEVKVDGVLKVLGADYAVTGVGGSNGGNVVFVAAPAIAAVVQRARKVPYVRTVDYQANGDFKEETVDTDLDIAEMQVQQIAADVARAFKAPLSVTTDLALTDADWTARAGKFIRVKNDGTNIELVSAAPDLSTFTATGVGMVARSWSAKVGEEYSVLDAGAVGDGVTDDTAACQKAHAQAAGRRVVYPAGFTFLVSGITIAIARQIAIIRGKVKLKDASNQPIFAVAANRVKILGEGDAELDGNKVNQTAVTEATGSGIWLNDAVNKFEARGFYLHDTKLSGIAAFGNNPDCVVFGCEITDPGFMGIYPSQASNRPSKRWQISANNISGFLQDGIGTVAIQNSVISGNRIVIANTGVPIKCISLEGECNDTAVFGNTMEGSASVANPNGGGIQVNDSRRVSVLGNTFRGLSVAVDIHGAVATTGSISVVGNTAYDCGYGGWAFQVQPTAANSDMRVTIAHNTIEDCPYTPIALHGASHCQVIGNNIRGVNLQNTLSKRFIAGITLSVQAYFNTIANNVIDEGVGGNMKIGIHENATAAGSDSGNNTIRDNRIIGADFDIVCGGTAYGHAVYSKVTRVSDAGVTAAPVAGHWERGQHVLNEQPTAGDFAGWVCTASGTFSATAPTGSINTGTNLLTLSSAVGIYAGMKIRVAGAGPAAANLDTYVQSFDGLGLVCSLANNAGTTVVAAAVTLLPPTFARVGTIALESSVAFDPPNLADGAGTTTTVNVAGAALGDYVEISFSLDLQGITLTGWVSVVGVVSARFQNESGGALDLANGTLRARVRKL